MIFGWWQWEVAYHLRNLEVMEEKFLINFVGVFGYVGTLPYFDLTRARIALIKIGKCPQQLLFR